jgi:hypothetical protein
MLCSVDGQQNLSYIVCDWAERQDIMLDNAFYCLRIGCSDTGQLALHCCAIQSSDKELLGHRTSNAGSRTDTCLPTLGDGTAEWYRLWR